MKNLLPLILAALVLAACNVVVTTPEQPQLSVAVPALEGRWHNLDKNADPDPDEYLEVTRVDDQNHYAVAVYEGDRKQEVYQLLLCPARGSGDYWGFARQEDFSAGFLLFHLALRGDEVQFRWLDEEKTQALVSAAGLPFGLDQDTRIVRFSTLKIHAPWKALLEVLNGEGVDVLDSAGVLFRRRPNDGKGEAKRGNSSEGARVDVGWRDQSGRIIGYLPNRADALFDRYGGAAG